ncbi:MAG: ArsR family transcriptional regulator [Promethearchaeota archaeon]
MSIWNVSDKVKEKILDAVQKLEDNEIKILFLLKNLGPLRFTDLIEHSGLSRSTVSKYLKININKNCVEKNLFFDKSANTKEQRYFITQMGLERLNDLSPERAGFVLFNEVNTRISQLSELIDFYEKIGIEDSIILEILQIVLKIGDNFFLMEQNKDLYLTLFYIFLNSVSTPDYKLEIHEFCRLYSVKKVRIDFYIDKIMSNQLGFYMFTRYNEGEGRQSFQDIFFFHEEDIIGTTTLRLIKDKLLSEMLHVNLSGYKPFYDLDEIAEEIASKLIKMALIWERIKEPFEMLIEKIFIKTAVDAGFSKPFLMDMVIQSEKILKSREGMESLIRIIEGSQRYEDLNIVSISESPPAFKEDLLENIKGFCYFCGKTILKNELSNTCSKCGNVLEVKKLLRSLDDAFEVSKKFKEEKLQEDLLIECPNPKCSFMVKVNWERCPECNALIKKSPTRKGFWSSSRKKK